MNKNWCGLIFAMLLLLQIPVASAADLCVVREQALNYVLHSQQEISGDVYQAGEWRLQFNASKLLRTIPGVLSSNASLEDSTVFLTAVIHNILAEIYLQNPQGRQSIKSAIEKAISTFPPYRTADGNYDYWRKSDKYPNNDVHLPQEQIFAERFEGMLAIPPDIDDTSTVQMALYLDREIEKTDNPETTPRSLPSIIESYRYLDIGRTPHIANWALGDMNTGAFLTWIAPEPKKATLQGAMAPASAGDRVFLEKNDVDCVANANVLRTLSKYGATETPGYANACRLLNKTAQKMNFNGCGVYYPNTYWYHYAVSRAFHDGALCLQDATTLSIQHILRMQNTKDGSWFNALRNDDRVLATVLAVGALIYSGNPQDPQQRAAVRSGVGYLLNKMRVSDRGDYYWTGGVFYSPPFPFRGVATWTSDAFTTASVVQILFAARNWINELKDCPNPN